ncbi:hypothetical protein NSK_006025 [Nannochloropsis salina CCMP1776]|uniref:OTU domain-containing protein n=1 Tax=Nannochloropsis salina CCMP1776 TaxID=1027361 RepID=A0A4D9D1V8_9STRA|nr:hypothetical protein NSK_006025 [Nannochloropsis salina CCMP1776]|eukprot:TFJ82599.1 hypothetical protein NSK_006025 [Nannochloropsis salina CCMP1776]
MTPVIDDIAAQGDSRARQREQTGALAPLCSNWVGSQGGEGTNQPFQVEALGRFDFRLKPTNFAPGFKTVRSTMLMDWDSIKLWYQGQNLLRDLERREYVAAGLRWSPFMPCPPAGEPVVRRPIEPLDEEEGQALRVLRDLGVNLRPVSVDGDGSCLVHAVSTALTGSQIYSDALRWAAHKELRDHADFYRQAGFVTDQDKARFLPRLDKAAREARARGQDDRERSMREAATEMRKFDNVKTGRPKWTAAFIEEAVEKARPSEGEARGPAQYLEEIHVAALANALRRPIMILAEGFQGGLFLPLRHDPEDCRLIAIHSPDRSDRASGQTEDKTWADALAVPPVFIFLQYNHYIPLVQQDPRDFWTWAAGPESGLEGDEAALEALRMYESERGTANHRIPEFVEEILTMCVGIAAQGMEEMLATYQVPATDREMYRQAFGKPELMKALPLMVVFEETPARCEKSVRNLKTMNALFRALGLEVDDDDLPTVRDVVFLSLYIHKVDFSRYRHLVWALYYLMSCEHQSVDASSLVDLATTTTTSPASPAPLAGKARSSPTACAFNSTSCIGSSKKLASISQGDKKSHTSPSHFSFSAVTTDSILQDTCRIAAAPSVSHSTSLQQSFPHIATAGTHVFPRGLLPSSGDLDQKVFKFVLNYSQNDDLNLGLARLYCEAEGWDLRLMLRPSRDPKNFLTKEMARLERRFQRLTGLDYRRVMDEDLTQDGRTVGALGGVEATASAEPRARVPKALAVLQNAIRTRPYPGRGTVLSSHVLLEQPNPDLLSWCLLEGESTTTCVNSCDEGICNASSASSTSSHGPFISSNEGSDQMDVARYAFEGGGLASFLLPLAQILLQHTDARRELLKELLRRGLPQNQQFEQVACAVLLPERFNKARTRFCFLDWILNAADAGLPNIEKKKHPAAHHRAVKKIIVRPLTSPACVPPLAALFSPQHAIRREQKPALAAPASSEQYRQQMVQPEPLSWSTVQDSSSLPPLSPPFPSPTPGSGSNLVALKTYRPECVERHHGREEEKKLQQHCRPIQYHIPSDAHPSCTPSCSPAHKKVAWSVQLGDGTDVCAAHVQGNGGRKGIARAVENIGIDATNSKSRREHLVQKPSKILPGKTSSQTVRGIQQGKEFGALGKRGISSPL